MVDEYYIEGMRFKIVLYEGSEAMKSSSVHIQAFLPFRTLVVYGQELHSVILLKEVEVALPVIMFRIYQCRVRTDTCNRPHKRL